MLTLTTPSNTALDSAFDQLDQETRERRHEAVVNTAFDLARDPTDLIVIVARWGTEVGALLAPVADAIEGVLVAAAPLAPALSLLRAEFPNLVDKARSAPAGSVPVVLVLVLGDGPEMARVVYDDLDPGGDDYDYGEPDLDEPNSGPFHDPDHD